MTVTSEYQGELVAPGFGDRLREARRLTDYTKASDFARDSGLDRQTIRRLENGFQPGRRAREAILNTLHERLPIAPQWLFLNVGEPIGEALQRYLKHPLCVSAGAPSKRVAAELRKVPWNALSVANQTPQAIHRLRKAIEMNLRLTPP